MPLERLRHTPQLVCVWVPLVDATMHNGCLFVVPRELDTHWANASHPSHLRPALAVDGAPQLTEVSPTLPLSLTLSSK